MKKILIITMVILSSHLMPAYAKPVETLNRIGIYGDNNVGLYRSENMCFITFSGHRDDKQEMGLAVWLPNTPNVILLFPTTKDASEALEIAESIDHETAKIRNTDNTFMLGDEIYPLSTNDKAKPYKNLAAAFDVDPKDELIKMGTFVILMKDGTEENKSYSIGFGTKGLEQALAIFQKDCSQEFLSADTANF